MTNTSHPLDAIADTNRRLFGSPGYSPADEHSRLTAQLARLDAEIARVRLDALAPFLALAAVGQHIHDIDADRAWDLARRNASQDRIQRWAVESARGALSLDDLEARAFHPLFPVRAALGLCVCEGPHGPDDATVCASCGGEL